MNSSLVRGIIAIVFALAVTAGFFLDKTPPEAFFALAGSAITYYFTKQTEERIIQAASAATTKTIAAMATTIDAKKTP